MMFGQNIRVPLDVFISIINVLINLNGKDHLKGQLKSSLVATPLIIIVILQL